MSLEKKNKMRAVLLVLLLLATGGLLFLMQQPEAALVDPSLFKVEALDKIDHIVLQSKKDTIDLRFDGSRWMVNNTYEADQQLIETLFATVEQAVPKREVSKTAMTVANEQLAAAGVKVSWMEGDVVKKAFVAGGNAQKTEAYFQLPDGRDYIVTIPGYRVYTSGIFEIEESMWRDKRVFNFNWRNFKTLSVKFPAEPKEDFSVSLKGNYFGIDGVAQVDTTRLNDYLDAVSLLGAKEFLSASKRAPYDTVLQKAPAFVVEVKDIASRTYSLEIYTPQPGSADVLGRLQQTEVAVFERNAIIPLAKRRAYFIHK